jgi:hypothetical protein
LVVGAAGTLVALLVVGFLALSWWGSHGCAA